MADRPEGVDQLMPLSYWIAIGVVVFLLLIVLFAYRGMFGVRRRPTRDRLRKRKYQGRRRVDLRNPDQVRPADVRATMPEIEDDYARVLPNPMPLAIEGPPVRNPVPYRYASRAQHKEPLPVAEELSR